MRFARLIPLVLLGLAMPAKAEKLTFDYRLYPPLKAVLDSGNRDMIMFNNGNPKYISNRIAIQGKSAKDWTEAIEIVTRVKSANMKNVQDWMQEIQSQSSATCPGEYTTLGQDDNSISFSRRSMNCPNGTQQTAVFRIVSGKKSLFLLAGIYKGQMTDAMRQQILAMLQSAHMEQ